MLGVLVATLVPLVGVVEDTTARWFGDAIVTDARVRTPVGVSTITQLGGSLDGIGMVFSHVPETVQRGDRVALSGGRIVGVTRAAATTGTAAYGVQRTRSSGRPLVRLRALELVYDAAGTTTIPGQLELAELDEAFWVWLAATESCNPLLFDRQIEAIANARDGRDSIRFLEERWCRPRNGTDPEICYPPEARAVTRLVFVDDPANPDDGTILEADIDLNAVDGALTIGGAGFDLRSVITHEIGHALGLDHTCHDGIGLPPADADGVAVPACSDASATARDATMYIAVDAGDTRMRTLENADVDGACALFARRGSAKVTGGCQAQRFPSGGLVLVLLLVALRRGGSR